MKNTNEKYFLQESDRLYYRKVTNEDIEGWIPFFENNDRLHFLGIDSKKSNETHASEWVEKQLVRYKTEGLGLLAVVDKSNGVLIGMCGIIPRVINDKDELEIGYSFKPESWGKGYATEASRTMREFGMKNNMAKRFISIIHKDNVDSMKVAIRNGMKPLFDYTYLGMEVIIHGTS